MSQQVTVNQAMQLAVQHHQAGRLSEAESIYRQVLTAHPEFPDAMYLLGAVAQQVGRHDVATDLISRALARKGGVAAWHSGLGVSLAFLGKLDEAMDEFTRAITIQPSLADAHLNLGNTFNLKGMREEAIRCFRKAIELQPHYAEAHFNLANALRHTAADEAIEEYRKVAKMRPDLPVVHAHLGETLHQRRRLDEAIESYRRAIRLQPNLPEPNYNLGVVLAEAGRTEEAISAYQSAIRVKPDYAAAHFNLAVAMGETAPVEDVLHEFREVLRIDPQQRVAFDNALHLQHYIPTIEQKALFEEHREWARRFEAPVLAAAKPLESDRDPERRLRIGYVSRDFRTHSVSFFIEPILRAHDRTRFEIYCYADEIVPDETTRRLRELADAWQDTTALSDEELADQVRADQIDILIDLAGHTDQNRLMVFARKPAPLQATWLGYPDTTGMASIDFRITDVHADPAGAEAFATEKLLRLPSGWCYQPPQSAPPPVAEVRERSGITFGCFNSIAKINAPLAALWSDLLKRSRGSRLLLKARGLDNRDVAARVAKMFTQHGIEPDRLELVGAASSIGDHLATYHRIDVALDTFPYHGTTTTCEALWMGVPVVTLAGHTHASRVGVSLLTHVGVRDWVAPNRGRYIDYALAAADATDVRGAALRDRVRVSALMDAATTTASLERELLNATRALAIDSSR